MPPKDDTAKRAEVQNFLYNVEAEQEEVSKLIMDKLSSNPDLSSERSDLLGDVFKKVNGYYDILENLKEQNEDKTLPISKLQEELLKAHDFFQWVKKTEIPRVIAGKIA